MCGILSNVKKIVSTQFPASLDELVTSLNEVVIPVDCITATTWRCSGNTNRNTNRNLGPELHARHLISLTTSSDAGIRFALRGSYLVPLEVARSVTVHVTFASGLVHHRHPISSLACCTDCAA